MTATDILNRAADAIETRGHHKGGLVGPNGEVCLLGSLVLATWPDYADPRRLPMSRFDRGPDHEAYTQAENILVRHVFADIWAWGSIPEMNDNDPELNTHTAAALLRQLAKEASPC